MQREKLASGAEQAAEKVKSSEKNCEIHPSAAKAGVNPIDLSARVNSCPFKTALGTSFSAACKALTDFNSLDARAEARTLQIYVLRGSFPRVSPSAPRTKDPFVGTPPWAILTFSLREKE
jgi:hypothetical protein